MLKVSFFYPSIAFQCIGSQLEQKVIMSDLGRVLELHIFAFLQFDLVWR